MFKIYFTSDIHGYFFSPDPAREGNAVSGAFSLWQDFPSDENTLCIDGGDSLQGSPLLFHYHKKGEGAKVAAEFYNEAPYRYYTLGNHDFNYGYDVLKDYTSRMKAKLLVSNVEDLTGELPITPYAIHKMPDGTRVGIVGAVTHWVNLWEKPEHIEKLRITSPLEAARKYYDEVRAQSDFTILLYHGGIEEDLVTGENLTHNDENQAAAMAHELSYDLILTGHQHMPLGGAVIDGTHLVQPPANARAYCLITVDQGKITSSLRYPEKKNTLLEEKYASLQEEVLSAMSVPIAKLPEPLLPEDKLTMAVKGSPLADFVNRVQLEFSGADVSITSFANEIVGLPRDVTIMDIMMTYRFPNTLIVLTITGDILKRAIEHDSCYVMKEGDHLVINKRYTYPKEEHYNYDFFYPVTFDTDYAAKEGERISNLCLNGREILPTDTLKIVMNSYRATGAGGFDMYLEASEKREIPKEVQELLIEKISEMA